MRLKKLLLSATLFIAATGLSMAQWECPSQLAANLKPIGKSGLYWSGEFTLGGGYIDHNWIRNGMAIVGLDWSTAHSTFYIEGGSKYWNRYDIDASNEYENKHLGIRELYYQYKAKQSSLTFGIQSMRLDDDFLLNERVAGVSWKRHEGPWALNVVGGSVTKNFARNGTFCNVAYLYDIFYDRQRALLGNRFGQTNLAALSLKYSPGKSVSSKKASTSDDGFSSDEFSDGLGGETESAGRLKVESLGAVAYTEFGSWTDHNFLTTGFFGELTWGNNWLLKPEVLLQASSGNNALIYSAKLEKMLNGEKSKTSLSLRYIGKAGFNSGAFILNSFSNIFAGDIARLDAIDLPFAQAGMKMSFPKYKFHLKTQLAAQVGGTKIREADFELGKKFGKHLQTNLIGGLIDSNSLVNEALMGRIEIRYNF